MRLSSITSIAAAVVLAMPGVAAAQQRPAYQQLPGRSDAIIGVGLTVPLGEKRGRSEPPRIDLRVARDTVYLDGRRASDLSAVQMETRIGVSLDGERRLMINGRPIERDKRQNISDTGLILAGVGAALIIGIVVLYDRLEDQSE